MHLMRISFKIESKVFEMIYIQECPGNSDDENCRKTFFHQMIKIIILLKTYHVRVLFHTIFTHQKLV